MNEREKFNEACRNLSAAMTQTVDAFAEWFRSVMKPLVAALDTERIRTVLAYNKAKAEHPEWVWRATRCKKRRIRKKYHDKIMRQYGRCDDGK